MIPIETARLARALVAFRPDWAEKDLRLFLDEHMSQYSYADAVAVCCAVAVDPATQKIGRVLQRGPWWKDTNPATMPTHQPPPFVPERVVKATPEQIRAIREAARP